MLLAFFGTKYTTVSLTVCPPWHSGPFLQSYFAVGHSPPNANGGLFILRFHTLPLSLFNSITSSAQFSSTALWLPNTLPSFTPNFLTVHCVTGVNVNPWNTVLASRRLHSDDRNLLVVAQEPVVSVPHYAYIIQFKCHEIQAWKPQITPRDCKERIQWNQTNWDGWAWVSFSIQPDPFILIFVYLPLVPLWSSSPYTSQPVSVQLSWCLQTIQPGSLLIYSLISCNIQDGLSGSSACNFWIGHQLVWSVRFTLFIV